MENTVQGFLRRQGQDVFNDAGPVILQGWGIGNWLLPEGYMWESQGAHNFDRPRRIEARIAELLGPEKAAEFWPRFRQVFFTQVDVQYIKDQGYNSIRLPFDAALFLEEGPGIHFKEAGFQYLEDVVRWCRAADLYVIFDMHAAPGGQTGANIDNAMAEIPRLFVDQDQFDKGVALWAEIARRFKDDPVVGGYDLLNEPIRPATGTLVDYDRLLPRLAAFYETTIAAVRQVDQAHLFSLEGHHWASDPRVFTHVFDENMVIHFHRYGGFPEKAQFTPWLELRDRLNVPLWLGETGENKPQWYSALTQFCTDANIGYCFWPYKKMGKRNGSVTVKTPAGWDAIIAYVKGGVHPGYAEAAATFEQLLLNMALVNCERNPDVDASILRTAGMTLRATDFRDADCQGGNAPKNFDGYRITTPMTVTAIAEPQPSNFGFDSHWDRFVLTLTPDESVTYLTPLHKAPWQLAIALHEAKDAVITAQLNGETITFTVGGNTATATMPANSADDVLTIAVSAGEASLLTVTF
ncbi:glycoside hydrolase family 5 protein [Lacticaseibacillus yichunensis]|uniref:Glycoside hydrolase family 5 protein n=1 Tax=Lacticaseibacillus yichunensis TaxID=2486015 RepID=A0ABW4CQY1_9LACO|nr:cellulase family glycosylhydrolase [Lacticaseibacillus yichunensis]